MDLGMACLRPEEGFDRGGWHGAEGVGIREANGGRRPMVRGRLSKQTPRPAAVMHGPPAVTPAEAGVHPEVYPSALTEVQRAQHFLKLGPGSSLG